MSIENRAIVDFIDVNENNEVVLTISDPLDWKRIKNHLKRLQDKINAYIYFIESGEIYARYQESVGKQIVIEVVGKYDLPNEANDFYAHVAAVLVDFPAIVKFKKL